MLLNLFCTKLLEFSEFELETVLKMSINLEFPTNRFEVDLVAKLFDREEAFIAQNEGQAKQSAKQVIRGRGRIVGAEFVEAIRTAAKAVQASLIEQRSPAQEAIAIQDELQRKAFECLCRRPYRINRVGENKYRVETDISPTSYNTRFIIQIEFLVLTYKIRPLYFI